MLGVLLYKLIYFYISCTRSYDNMLFQNNNLRKWKLKEEFESIGEKKVQVLKEKLIPSNGRGR